LGLGAAWQATEPLDWDAQPDSPARMGFGEWFVVIQLAVAGIAYFIFLQGFARAEKTVTGFVDIIPGLAYFSVSVFIISIKNKSWRSIFIALGCVLMFLWWVVLVLIIMAFLIVILPSRHH
jgi:hypothetical protein